MFLNNQVRISSEGHHRHRTAASYSDTPSTTGFARHQSARNQTIITRKLPTRCLDHGHSPARESRAPFQRSDCDSFHHSACRYILYLMVDSRLIQSLNQWFLIYLDICSTFTYFYVHPWSLSTVTDLFRSTPTVLPLFSSLISNGATSTNKSSLSFVFFGCLISTSKKLSHCRFWVKICLII